MRVVEVERRTKGEVTYLGASTLLRDDEWSAEQVADLYFDRWPAQEGGVSKCEPKQLASRRSRIRQEFSEWHGHGN